MHKIYKIVKYRDLLTLSLTILISLLIFESTNYKYNNAFIV